MSLNPVHEVPFTFCDVVSCFSEDELKLLHDWQKELYNNVMKEIHQALNSLGPLIASSVFSLRPKEPEDLSSADLSDLEMKPSIDPFATVDATPEYEMFGQYQYTMDAHDTGGRESHNVPINEQAGFPLVNTEVDAPLKDYQCSERKHSICVSPELEITKPVPPICMYEEGETNAVNIQAYQSSPAAGFPLVNTEVDAPLKDYQCSERKHSICVSPEPEITKPVPPICMYEQGETNAVNIQEYQRSPEGNRVMTRTEHLSNSVRHSDRSRHCKSTSNVANGNAILSKPEAKVSISHMWPGSGQQMNTEKTEQWQTGRPAQTLCKASHMAPDAQTTHVNKKRENVTRKCNGPSKSNPQQSSRSYTYPEAKKTGPNNRSVSHPGAKAKRKYACSECGKTFATSSTLIIHERIHTGERPFRCEICVKSFNQKGALQRHEILHTGEKPYQCKVCGKCFTRKHNLVGHQKVHIRVDL